MFQEEDLDIKELSSKFFWYGTGDYNFFQLNKNKFSFMEKIMSLSHVFRKYFLKFPLKSILVLNFNLLFLYIFGIIRYFGFLSKFFIKKKFNLVKFIYKSQHQFCGFSCNFDTT